MFLVFEMDPGVEELLFDADLHATVVYIIAQHTSGL